jgi:hypothetical protein
LAIPSPEATVLKIGHHNDQGSTLPRYYMHHSSMFFLFFFKNIPSNKKEHEIESAKIEHVSSSLFHNLRFPASLDNVIVTIRERCHAWMLRKQAIGHQGLWRI